MKEPVLHLKGGETRAFLPTDAAQLREILDCVFRPPRDPARLFPLATPEGQGFQVAARDIAAVEMPPSFCLVNNFLPPHEIARAEAHAQAHLGEFADATVSLPSSPGVWKADYSLRQARIMNDIKDMMPMFVPRLDAALPHIWPRLGSAPVPFRNIECQMSAHGDGDYFLPHTDNGLPDIAHRMVSYVYYFHREPKAFGGGLLRFYASLLMDGQNMRGRQFADIEPPRNSLMVFPSQCWHEVTPVTCPSPALADQRITLNGWLCK